MTKWIKIKEQMPEYNKRILVLTKHDAKMFVVTYTKYGWRNSRGKIWQGRDLLAWLPIPEPIVEE